MRTDYTLSQLDVLESESIHVIREVAAEFERPALLFSGGKDSVVMLALAEKAFRPARIPFPVMHVDTGHNFSEVIEFRDKRAAELGVRLDRRLRAGIHRRGPGDRGDRPLGQPEPAADRHAAGRDRGAPFRRAVRRRAAGRGEGPRQGAGVLVPRRLRPVGPEEPAARAVEPLQHPDPAGASTSVSSRCRTGPSSTSGTTSSARSSSCRRSTSRTTGRSSSGTASCWPRART